MNSDSLPFISKSDYIVLVQSMFTLKKTTSEYDQVMQGSHRLEKCLNIQDCLKKSLKIKFYT